MVKGISCILTVIGDEAKWFKNQNLLLHTSSISVILTVPVTQARERSWSLWRSR